MKHRGDSLDIFSKYISTLNKNVTVYGILQPPPPDSDDKEVREGNQYDHYSGIDRSWIYKNTVKKYGNFPVGDIKLADTLCSECTSECSNLSNEVGITSCTACKDAHPAECKQAYSEILDNISTNIDTYLTVKEVSVNSIPENITEISLGKLDASGNFTLIKKLDLGKTIHQTSTTTFEFEPGFDLEGGTHLQIKYNSVEM